MACIDEILGLGAAAADTDELTFVLGLCYFKLGNLERAAAHFSRSPRWRLWHQKAVIMEQTAESCVALGDFSAPGFSNDPPFTQTDTTVTVTLQLGEWLRSEVRVELGFDSVDVFMAHGEVCPAVRSYELESPIDAPASAFAFTSAGLELRLAKRAPGQWKRVFVDRPAGHVNSATVMRTLEENSKNFQVLLPSEAVEQFEMSQIEALGDAKDRLELVLDAP
jgi:hypothetical protein